MSFAGPAISCLTLSASDGYNTLYEEVQRFETPAASPGATRLRNGVAERALRGLGLLCAQRQAVPAPVRSPDRPAQSGPVADPGELRRRCQILEPHRRTDRAGPGCLGDHRQPNPEPPPPAAIRAPHRPAILRWAGLQGQTPPMSDFGATSPATSDFGAASCGLRNGADRPPGEEQAASGSSPVRCAKHTGICQAHRPQQRREAPGIGGHDPPMPPGVPQHRRPAQGNWRTTPLYCPQAVRCTPGASSVQLRGSHGEPPVWFV